MGSSQRKASWKRWCMIWTPKEQPEVMSCQRMERGPCGHVVYKHTHPTISLLVKSQHQCHPPGDLLLCAKHILCLRKWGLIVRSWMGNISQEDLSSRNSQHLCSHRVEAPMLGRTVRSLPVEAKAWTSLQSLFPLLGCFLSQSSLNSVLSVTHVSDDMHLTSSKPKETKQSPP